MSKDWREDNRNTFEQKNITGANIKIGREPYTCIIVERPILQ